MSIGLAVNQLLGRPAYQLALLLALLLAASISTGAGVARALSPEGNQDLAPVYLRSRLWIAGVDPYQPLPLEERRALVAVGEIPDGELRLAPSTPYPPNALVQLAAISWLSWDAARLLWLGLTLVLAAAIPLVAIDLWYGRWSLYLKAAFVLFWFCSVGLRSGIGLGQHSVFVFASLLIAIRLLRDARRLPAVILLGLAMHKPSVGLPVLGYLFLRTRVWIAVGAGLVAAALVGIFLLRVSAPAPVVMENFLAGLDWWDGVWFGRQSPFVDVPQVVPGTGATDLFPLLALLLPLTEARFLMYALGALAALYCCYLFRRAGPGAPTDIGVAAFSMVSLSFYYHEITDTLPLLLAMGALIQQLLRPRVSTDTAWRRATLAVLAVLIVVWLADVARFAPVIAWIGRAGGSVEIATVVIDSLYRLSFLLGLAYLLVLQWSRNERGRLQPGAATFQV